MAPTHFRIADLSGVEPKPPVLWLRGANDVIVSDTSLYDLAYLGSLGVIPGWPGEQTWPPQPMVAQTRAVLLGYAAAGGRFRQDFPPDCVPIRAGKIVLPIQSYVSTIEEESAAP